MTVAYSSSFILFFPFSALSITDLLESQGMEKINDSNKNLVVLI